MILFHHQKLIGLRQLKERMAILPSLRHVIILALLVAFFASAIGCRSILNQSNHSPLDLGDLKQIASEARDEIDIAFAVAGGAGPAIDDLIDGLVLNYPNDLSPVTLSQLKHVSMLFFDRFAEIGFTPTSVGWPATLVLDEGAGDRAKGYPWRDDVVIADASPATLEQANHLFSWDLTSWVFPTWNAPELFKMKTSIINAANDPYLQMFYDPAGEIVSIDDLLGSEPANSYRLSSVHWDFDGDGIDNYSEYLKGTNPVDFFNGSSATIKIYTGDRQTGRAGAFMDSALHVKVFSDSGQEILESPVLFSIIGSAGGLSANRTHSVPTSKLKEKTSIISASAVYSSPEVLGDYQVRAEIPNRKYVIFTLSVVPDANKDRAYSHSFKETIHSDGTVTHSWISDAQPGEWIRIYRKQDDGSSRVVYNTIYGSPDLPYVPGNKSYSLTIDQVPFISGDAGFAE
jgi:hypothetical protein